MIIYFSFKDILGAMHLYGQSIKILMDYFNFNVDVRYFFKQVHYLSIDFSICNAKNVLKYTYFTYNIYIVSKPVYFNE